MKYQAGKHVGLFLSVLAIVSASGCQQRTVSTATIAEFSVSMELDYQGTAENKKFDVKLSDGDSVFDALLVALDEGKLIFDSRGTGETAFVNSIDGVENEMAGGSSWVFFVNDKLGDRGCDEFVLHEGDKVLWKFKANGLE